MTTNRLSFTSLLLLLLLGVMMTLTVNRLQLARVDRRLIETWSDVGRLSEHRNSL